jgi:diguanylate cyclase (GGDEF)-like protein
MYRDISEQVKATQAAKEHAESLNVWVNELQLRTLQMTLLNDMAGLLQCSASSEEAFTVVGEAARNLFVASTSGALFIFKSSRNLLEVAATWGKNYASEPMFTPDSCWSLRRGLVHWSESPGGSAVCPHLRNAVPANYLCVPMVAQGDTVGILHIQYDRSTSNKGMEAFETLQDSQQRLATAVASQVALSLASLRLRETLRDQSIRDPLTGLFNRRFMQESLDRELQRARRKNRPLTVIFLDLDHFKRFNDVFGHDAGDAVLKAMAELFGNHFRGEDVICRYGGEEFAMILPESSSADAAARANELREAARFLKVVYKGMPLDPVTLSIGVASYPEHASNGEELMQMADKCLYVSKAKGRDRVTVAVAGQDSSVETPKQLPQ